MSATRGFSGQDDDQKEPMQKSAETKTGGARRRLETDGQNESDWLSVSVESGAKTLTAKHRLEVDESDGQADEQIADQDAQDDQAGAENLLADVQSQTSGRAASRRAVFGSWSFSLCPPVEAAITLVSLLALVTAIALAGAQDAPAPTTATLKATVGRVCPALAENPGKILVAAEGQGRITTGLVNGEMASRETSGFQLDNATSPQFIAADEQTGVLSAGLQISSAGQQRWGACLPTSAQQYLLFDGGESSTLQLSNPHEVEALVSVTLTGPDGEIVAENLRDLRVPPKESSVIDLGAVIKRATPVSVRVLTSTGRVSASIATQSSKGADFVSPSGFGRQIVIAAVPPKARKTELLLINPATTRTFAKIEFLGTNGRFVPDGGQRVSIEAGRAQSIDLTSPLRGEAGSIVVTAESPVSAAMVSRAEQDFAYSAGQVILPGANPAIQAVPVAGQGSLLLSNFGDSPAVATITWGAGVDATSRDIPAGATIELPTPQGATEVRVVADAKLVGGIVLGNSKQAGISIAPLLDFDAARARTPIRVEPKLGG